MTSKNPYKYSGSGLHWKRHLKLHGKQDKNNFKNPNYDFMIRTFVHSPGITERCTQRELINKYSLRESSVCSLIKGNLKSTSKWRINHG